MHLEKLILAQRNSDTKPLSARKEALRKRLVEVSFRLVENSGTSMFTARALAKEADVAIGTIYTVFDDMREVLLSVNYLTFQQMGASIAKSILPDDQQTPLESLQAQSQAYLDYALANKNRWKALFDIEVADADKVPDWYLACTDGLFAMIDEPVQRRYPNMPREEQRLITRTLFSAVHGVVTLGVDRRLVSVPLGSVDKMIKWLLDQAVAE